MPSYSYDDGLGDAISIARLHLGDTEISPASKAKFPDETYEALLKPSGATPLAVAAQLARSLAARYSAKVTTDLDNQQTNWSDLAKQYHLLASRLDAQLAAGAAQPVVPAAAGLLGGGIYVGGTSARSVWADRADPDHPDNVNRGAYERWR